MCSLLMLHVNFSSKGMKVKIVDDSLAITKSCADVKFNVYWCSIIEFNEEKKNTGKVGILGKSSRSIYCI